MTQAVTQHSGDFMMNRPTILLLGDDGRMLNLLRHRFSRYRLLSADNALDGILLLGESTFHLVLVNAEATGNKTAEVVKALRRIRPEIKVLVYGEPFAEQFSRGALKAGAADYLVWPVPVAELQVFLGTPTGQVIPEPAKSQIIEMESAANSDTHNNLIDTGLDSNGALPLETAEILQQYRKLALLIPKGRHFLVEQAQQVLAEMLGVEWVMIYPTNHSKEDQAAVEPEEQEPGRMLVMRGPIGPVGEMFLGPAIRTELKRRQMAQQAADYLGTLMHLANRDESLKHLATIDELTGAYNRRYLEYFLRRMIEQSKLEHTDVTLLLFDIDNFKHYNDTYGHSAGDNILRQATKLMRRCCRAHDVVARMGGDEFAVLFWDTHRRKKVYEHKDEKPLETPELALLRQSVEDERVKVELARKSHAELAVFMSNRFRRMMHKSEFPGLGPEALGRLTISGGLAHFPLDSSGVGELLAKADEALLTAKRNGKNRLYLVGKPTAPEQEND